MSLPPYAYVPGKWPHPTRDPRGHSFALGEPPVVNGLDPERWQTCAGYLRGVELFAYGYYWEAHEEWEGLWQVAAPGSAARELLQGLIQLAAAGLKVRQDKAERAAMLGERAQRHFERGQAVQNTGSVAGFRWSELLAFAAYVQGSAALLRACPDADVAVVFERSLTPDGGPALG